MRRPSIPWIKDNYVVAGLMSGTSLDGLDMVLCEIQRGSGEWTYHIIAAQTAPYPDQIKEQLATAQFMDGLQLCHLHNTFGDFLGLQVHEFLSDQKAPCDLIASHGHTIFHRPDQGLTLQVGNGLQIAYRTGISTVFDFRSQDVTLGGQGAPLVPIGDRLLFTEYDYCLNLGGFSNISYEEEGRRLAFDPSPVNFIINHCMQPVGEPYDKDGQTARSGTLHGELLNALNALDYYQKKGPKSLGREWVETDFLPVLDRYKLPLKDQLRTIYEHIAIQISNSLNSFEKGRILVTGGGVYNIFLLELLTRRLLHKVIIPPSEIIDYKEALIFALLGVLRFREETNCLASVTGACQDHSSGMIAHPYPGNLAEAGDKKY